MTAEFATVRNYYSLDGIPLHDPYGRWTLAEGAQIRSVPARRNTEHVIPGMDGSFTNLSPTYEPGSLSFAIHIIKASTHDEAMNFLEFWNGVLGQRNRLLNLDHTYNGSTKRAQIQIVASTETNQVIMRGFTINAIASIPNSFWRDISYSTSRFSLSGTTTLTGHSGGTGPINDSIIKLTGPFTSVRLTTPNNPENVLTFDTPISSTQEIIVDTKGWKARIRNKSTSFSTTAGVRVAPLSSHGTGTMFSLDPTFNYTTLGKDYSLIATSVGATTDSYGEVYAKRSYL